MTKLKAIIKLINLLTIDDKGHLLIDNEAEGYCIRFGPDGIKLLTLGTLTLNGKYVLANCEEGFEPEEEVEEVGKERREEVELCIR